MTFDDDMSQWTQSVTTFDTKIKLFVCTMKRCERCQSVVTCKDQYPQDVITSTVIVWRNENDAINLYCSAMTCIGKPWPENLSAMASAIIC